MVGEVRAIGRRGGGKREVKGEVRWREERGGGEGEVEERGRRAEGKTQHGSVHTTEIISRASPFPSPLPSPSTPTPSPFPPPSPSTGQLPTLPCCAHRREMQ